MSGIFSSPDVEVPEAAPVATEVEVNTETASKQKSASKKKTSDYAFGSLNSSRTSPSTGRQTLGGA